MLFSLGNLMPGKKVLVETEDADEGSEEGPVVLGPPPMMCNLMGCDPSPECRCGGLCGNSPICDDQAKEEWKQIRLCTEEDEGRHGWDYNPFVKGGCRCPGGR